MSNLSSEEIYTLLDSIESDHEQDIDNLMNDSDTEFVSYSLLEQGVSHKIIKHAARQYSKVKFDSNKFTNRSSCNATSTR